MNLFLEVCKRTKEMTIAKSNILTTKYYYESH